MQPICSKCRAPLRPGSVFCPTCGTPVSAGGGSSTPAMRAGVPPASSYSQPPAGAPAALTPASAPYSPASPYSTPPGSSYRRQRARRRGMLFGALGLIVVCIVGIVVVANVVGKFKQEVTTGPHITNIQVGTGIDEHTGEIKGATDTFHTGEKVYVAFTVVTQDPKAHVVLYLYANGTLEATDSVPLDPDATHYGDSVVVRNTGEHKVEVVYNGAAEASITFHVT